MTEAYEKLKALLDEKKTLSNADVEQAEAEHGALTDEEKFDLEAKKLELAKAGKSDIVTLEQYQEALNVLDNAAEGSEEYKKAEAIADKFESQ